MYRGIKGFSDQCVSDFECTTRLKLGLKFEFMCLTMDDSSDRFESEVLVNYLIDLLKIGLSGRNISMI